MTNKIFQRKEEQKFLWLARILIIFITMGFISNIILLWTFLKIMPNTKVQPIYIRSTNIEDREIYVTKNMFNLMQEIPESEHTLYSMKYEQPGYYMAMNLVKKYIIDRESFIPDNEYMQILHGNDSDIKFMSSDQIYKDFVKNVKYENNKRVVRFITQPNTSDRLSDNPEWISDIEIDTINKQGDVISAKKARVKIKAHFNPKLFIRNEKIKYKNPLGFIIDTYKKEETGL